MGAAGLPILVLALVSTVSGFQPLAKTTATAMKLRVTSQSTMATDNNINSISNADHVLFDLPVSNNGARCRIILYKKGISRDKVDIVSPATLGGLKSEEYIRLSPLGLMPCLAIQKSDNPHGISSLVESDTIARYLLSEYPADGPTFLPDHPRSNQISRWHDMYLDPIQGCLYKPASRLPLGDYPDRKSAIAAYRRNLDVIEGFLGEDAGSAASPSPAYLCGGEVSLADATLFPSAVFASYMLPKFDEGGAGAGRPPLPPRLTRWFDDLRANDEVFSRVYREIMNTLVTSWEETNRRWDGIWLAGLRDDAPPTIFDKIISGEIPADIVRRDEHVLAFRDINPMAPAHVLVIPRDRNGLTSLRRATAEHTDILGRLLVAAGEIASDGTLGFGDGARIVINDGPDGGQEVNHLHVHVLGGRKMGHTFG